MIDGVVVNGIPNKRDDADVDQRKDDHQNSDQQYSEPIAEWHFDWFNCTVKTVQDLALQICARLRRVFDVAIFRTHSSVSQDDSSSPLSNSRRSVELCTLQRSVAITTGRLPHGPEGRMRIGGFRWPCCNTHLHASSHSRFRRARPGGATTDRLPAISAEPPCYRPGWSGRAMICS